MLYACATDNIVTLPDINSQSSIFIGEIDVPYYPFYNIRFFEKNTGKKLKPIMSQQRYFTKQVPPGRYALMMFKKDPSLGFGWELILDFDVPSRSLINLGRLKVVVDSIHRSYGVVSQTIWIKYHYIHFPEEGPLTWFKMAYPNVYEVFKDKTFFLKERELKQVLRDPNL